MEARKDGLHRGATFISHHLVTKLEKPLYSLYRDRVGLIYEAYFPCGFFLLPARELEGQTSASTIHPFSFIAYSIFKNKKVLYYENNICQEANDPDGGLDCLLHHFPKFGNAVACQFRMVWQTRECCHGGEYTPRKRGFYS